MRPIIGITLDVAEKGSFSTRPHYALRTSYFDMIYKAGGLPVAIPYLHDAIDEYFQNISALIVPGGDYALQKDWYVDPEEDKPYPPSERLDFDIAIVKKALEKDIPLLGICAGMQIMGGVLGAKMTPNINKFLDTEIDHLNQKPAEELAHDIVVEPDSLLYKITGKKKFAINTAHAEAIISVPDALSVSAKAEDGAIEAIEIANKNFALGVQWHPEFFLEENDPNLLIVKALVEKAREAG